MKFYNLVWNMVDRLALLPTLIGLRTTDNALKFLDSIPRGGDFQLKVGVSSFTEERILPIVVVPDPYINEFFAWLYTYADGAMPLSMHCKVIGSSELPGFELIDNRRNRPEFKRWSSIITGEIMFRSGTENVLSDAATSWALLSYSFGAALAYNFYGDAPISFIDIFIERLKRLQTTESTSRSEFIYALENIWSVFYRAREFPHLPKEAIVYSFQLWMELSNECRDVYGSSKILQQMITELFQGDDFESESLEQRVIAFDKLNSSLSSSEHATSFLGGFVVAAAAFFVGKGTSHIYLLDGQKNRFAYLWVSLFAGLSDESHWDTRWISATRKIETLAEFYAAHDPLKAALTDLSWAEYSWILQSKDSANQFNIMPKMKNHFLTIEILPGIPLEVRLSRGEKINQFQPLKASPEGDNNLLLASRLEDIARTLRRQGGAKPGTPHVGSQVELDFEDRPESLKSLKRKR
jgi:hypothetical protein